MNVIKSDTRQSHKTHVERTICFLSIRKQSCDCRDLPVLEQHTSGVLMGSLVL